MPSAYTCLTCTHFNLTADPNGECQRWVPVTQLDSTDTQQTFWPVVAKTAWCGDHSAVQRGQGVPDRSKTKQNVRGRR